MLLMFGVGLHFSLKDLMAVKAIAIPGAIGQIAVATLLGWGVASLMGWPAIHGVIFGFSLATASTVVLLRAMEERRLLETMRGKIAVGWLIVEDLACVLALVMMPVMAGVFGPDAAKESHSLGSVLADIGWTFVQLGLFVAVMLVVGRRVIPWIWSASPVPGRVSCSPCRCWQSRWAWRSVRRCCSVSRSRWARSSLACCSTNRN